MTWKIKPESQKKNNKDDLMTSIYGEGFDYKLKTSMGRGKDSMGFDDSIFSSAKISTNWL